MKKICIIGHFGIGKTLLNGQTVKTKSINYELEKIYGKKEIYIIDTHGGLKYFPLIFIRLLYSFIICENIIIMPAHNGVKIFIPLCSIINIFFRRKIHYIVIGAWIPDYLEIHKFTKIMLRYINAIYVETNTLKRKLEEKRYSNIYLLKNFKNIKILEKKDLYYYSKNPIRFCTFSRVMKEKGIEDAVEIIKRINANSNICSLDIYGPIESSQISWFEELKSHFPNYIKYKGTVDSEKSIDFLKKYFVLLFPTRFFTEGIPGTIIDAYASGVPVISSKWESFDDVVAENITGIGYEFGDLEYFEKVVTFCINNIELVNNMKINCLEYAMKYHPEIAIKSLTENLK